MKRGFGIAGALLLLAILVRRAARHAPPAALLGPGPSADENAPPEALAKLATLREILRSRNDNDHRLDTDFNDLTPDDKRVFEEEYAKIAPERRNERGTIVFLLAQNLTAPRDWVFLREVVAEPPCLSLSDCARRVKPGGENEDVGDEVTLAYPALTALKGAEDVLAEARAKGRPRPQAAWSLVEAGKLSPVAAVARLAAKIEKAYGAKR